MAVVSLEYRHCSRKRPLYLKHSVVEELAAQARLQLIGATADLMSLGTLSGIDSLKINGLTFNLYIDTGNIVHDEQDKPVLGICEFDPGEPDAAMVSVSPVGALASAELVLSTLAHEIGHAIFDAPGWITDASKGPGLFDDVDAQLRRAYRTTTRDSDHLSKSVAAPDEASGAIPAGRADLEKDIHFAELRANEFMGSLLVPRKRLLFAVEELAPAHGVKIHRASALAADLRAESVRLSAESDVQMESLMRTLSQRFGVTPRFIEVRLERYGLHQPRAAAI
jgi:hypothetical protein